MTHAPPLVAWQPAAAPRAAAGPDFQPHAQSAVDETFEADADGAPEADARERSAARGPGYAVACAIAAAVGLTLACLLLRWLW